MLTDPHKTLRSFVELVLPESSARAGWTIDPEALIDAKDLFSIKLNIKIRFTAGRNKVGGAGIKYYEDGKPYHRITLSQDEYIDDANESLWHELTHCWQKEAWATKTGNSVSRFHRLAYKPMDGPHGLSYEHNRFEIHARQTAAKYKERMLLV